MRVCLAAVAALIALCAVPCAAQSASSPSPHARILYDGVSIDPPPDHSVDPAPADLDDPLADPAGEWAPWPTHEWSYATPWSQGMEWRGIREAFSYAAQKKSDALLVVRNGYIVAEWYSDGYGPDDRWRGWSIAKSFTSALTGMMIGDGRIRSVNDSVARYLPEWRERDHAPITIRHLLSMTSGLEVDGAIDYWLTRAADQNEYSLGIDPIVEPGEVWEYQQCGVQALCPIMINVTGKQPSHYARENLFDVIGMWNATWMQDAVGNTLTYQSVHASAQEFAKFGYLFLRDGEWDGQQVVPEWWVRESTSPSQFQFRDYGYLWWLNMGGKLWEDVPADAYQAEGLGEQHLYIVPSLNLVVIRFGIDVGPRWNDNTFLGTICESVR